MQSANPRTPDDIWWIKPNTLIGFGIIPLYIIIGAITNSYDLWEYWISFLLISSLYIGSQTIASLSRKSNLRDFNTFYFSSSRAQQTLDFLFFISLIGYLVWFWPLALNPSLIFLALSSSEGSIFTLRGTVETTPGLSTLAQCAILYSAFYAKLLTCKAIQKKRKYATYFIILLSLSIFRSWIWSERLALIEVICPFLVIYSASANKSKKALNRLRLFPAAATIVIYIIFSVFEYFRSWRHYSKTEENFLLFSLERLIKYYSSSVENGVGFLNWKGSPSYDGTYLFTFIYRLPYIGELIRPAVDSSESFQTYLDCCATNREYNLASWPFLIASDIGILPSIIFFYFIGVFFGILYNGFIKSKTNFIYYPVVYVSILELLRQHYLHNPRLTYVIIGAIAIQISLKYSRRPAGTVHNQKHLL